jgi:DNA gyrase subunit A
MREQFATPRRSEIVQAEATTDIEDLIEREDLVVTVSHGGYIKRVPLSAYRAQRRGGRGRAGMTTREEDFVSMVFVTDTHTPVLFFSTAGRAYELKGYRLPEGTPQSRGKAIVNVLPLEAGERIATIMPLPQDKELWDKLFIMFATSEGNVRRNALSDFINIKANGKIAIKLEDNERLIAVKTCTEHEDVLLATRQGKAIRFAATDIRQFSGRTSNGVRGIKLAKGDSVISMSIIDGGDFSVEERNAYLRQAARLNRSTEEASNDVEGAELGLYTTLSEERFAELAAREQFLLTVSNRGYGKRTSAYEYRSMGRGGQGFANMELTGKNGTVVASFPVNDTDHIMLVTDRGQLIRCPVKDIRIAGRRTQGVTLFRVSDNESVVSVACIAEENEETAGETADH